MNKEHISDYKARLEKELAEFMKLPVTEGSAEAVKSMIECLDAVEHLKHCAGIEDDAHTSERLTDIELRAWLQHMDGGSDLQHRRSDRCDVRPCNGRGVLRCDEHDVFGLLPRWRQIRRRPAGVLRGSRQGVPVR